MYPVSRVVRMQILNMPSSSGGGPGTMCAIYSGTFTLHSLLWLLLLLTARTDASRVLRGKSVGILNHTERTQVTKFLDFSLIYSLASFLLNCVLVVKLEIAPREFSGCSVGLDGQGRRGTKSFLALSSISGDG